MRHLPRPHPLSTRPRQQRRPRRAAALPYAASIAVLLLGLGPAAAQTSLSQTSVSQTQVSQTQVSQTFGSIMAPAGDWLAGARVGFDGAPRPAAGGGDATSARASGPMSGAGAGAPPSSAATAPTTGWTAWSGVAPLGAGVAGFGQSFGPSSGQSGYGNGFSTFGLGLASLAMTGRPGIVASGGVDYLVRPDLSVSFGYQQVDLGPGTLATGNLTRSLTEGTRVQGVGAGVNWRVAPNTTLSFGVSGHFVGSDGGGSTRNSAWDNGGDALSSAAIVAPPR